MPVYQVGELVRPNPHYWPQYEDLEYVGLIIELRDVMGVKPEAKIQWNNTELPRWSLIGNIAHVELPSMHSAF